MNLQPQQSPSLQIEIISQHLRAQTLWMKQSELQGAGFYYATTTQNQREEAS